jgi:hypothetical protein
MLKILIIAIFLVLLVGFLSFLLHDKAIRVSNAAFMELVENNKIESVLFTAGNEQVIGSYRGKGPLVYTDSGIINLFGHPSTLFEMLTKHRDKVRIFMDYAPVDDNFQRIGDPKKETN